MGVWIEISNLDNAYKLVEVTPFMGVWIEIVSDIEKWLESEVTPFMGVWIEMFIICLFLFAHCRHSLYGSVD